MKDIDADVRAVINEAVVDSLKHGEDMANIIQCAVENYMSSMHVLNSSVWVEKVICSESFSPMLTIRVTYEDLIDADVIKKLQILYHLP